MTRVIVTWPASLPLVSLIWREYSVIRQDDELALQMTSHAGAERKCFVEIILLQEVPKAFDCVNERQETCPLVLSSANSINAKGKSLRKGLCHELNPNPTKRDILMK